MKKMILISFLCSLFCCGCFNYIELSDEAIVTGIGIDKENDKYKISMMIANSNSTSSFNDNNTGTTTVVTGTGNSITDAIKDIEKIVPKTLYTGHISMLIISDKIAINGLEDIMDSVTRNPESMRKLYLTIAKDVKAEDVLKTLSPLETFPTQNVVNNINNSSSSIGTTSKLLLSTFISKTLNNGIDNIAPSITIEGTKKVDDTFDLSESEVPSNLKISNLALFKDYKLVGYVDDDTAKGINIIKNNINNTIVEISKEKENYTIIKLYNLKSKISLVGNIFKFNITTDGEIFETTENLNLTSEKTFKELNKELNNTIYSLIEKSIKETIKYDVDIFGLGNMIYKTNPKKWESIKDNYLDKVNYDIKVDANIKYKGTLKNTIKDQKNEKN